MENTENIPISSTPTDQHGQIMFALGSITGELKGIQARQDVTNGHVLQNTADIEALKNKNSKGDGEIQGKKQVWNLIFTVIGLIAGLLVSYFSSHSL